MSKRKKKNQAPGVGGNHELKQLIGILERRADDSYSIDDDQNYWRFISRVAYDEELANADTLTYETSFETCKIYYNPNKVIKLEKAA